MKEQLDKLRKEILMISQNLKQYKEIYKNDTHSDPGEVKANFMLAYRHLEDARMRIGKIIQASDGGVSVYDKK